MSSLCRYLINRHHLLTGIFYCQTTVDNILYLSYFVKIFVYYKSPASRGSGFFKKSFIANLYILYGKIFGLNLQTILLIGLMSLAGLPTTNALDAILLITLAPEAMIALSPIVTKAPMVALAPMRTFLPIFGAPFF